LSENRRDDFTPLDRPYQDRAVAEAQRLSSIGSFSWRVETDEITWSEQLYRIYEFDIGVPVTLELIRTRVHPEDISLLEKMIDEARGGADDFEWHYRLIGQGTW
jgi:hypothetical protein